MIVFQVYYFRGKPGGDCAFGHVFVTVSVCNYPQLTSHTTITRPNRLKFFATFMNGGSRITLGHNLFY